MRRLVVALALTAATPAAAQALLPTPASLRASGPGFTLTRDTVLSARDPGERAAAARFAELAASQGAPVPRKGGRWRTSIRFRRVAGVAPEGYRLTTSPAGAAIEASDDAGLFYGAVSLWQLATENADHHVAGVTIADAPRFPWRGVMLDSARHVQSVNSIRQLIDAMAASKLNRLHWHLVDDQGWRLPVSGYPKLTGVSAWRRAATAPGAPPLPVEGGFYTPAQIRDVVSYAETRHVTVVPEIDMPGHALAAIRAYPRLGAGVPIPPGTESDYGVFPWLYNTDDATFRFLETVLSEVMRLFPSRDIHIGGDEAVKDQWRTSPAIQARMRQLGLKDEDSLQAWFTARIARFLAKHGRRAVGWDEILDGGAPADVAVTSWRGVEGAVKAAQAGHDAVLSPAPLLYLDNRQGTGPGEPPGRGRVVTLGDVLAFDPVPPGLTADERRHILGLQANLWTEHVRTDARAAWMIWPRAAAVAEIGWAADAPRTVAGFAPALVAQLDRFRRLGVDAADSAFAVDARIDRQADGRIMAALSAQPGLPVRYTLDGSAPGPASAAYAQPLTVVPGERLRAATLLGARPLPGGYDSVVTERATRVRTSRQLTPCSEAVLLDLEDDYPAAGPRARFLLDIFHPCWRWDGAPVEGAHRIAVSVGRIPFNFQVGADRAKIAFRPPATPAGEVEVRAGCDGPLVATLPLAPAVSNPGVTRLEAALPGRTPSRSLCLTCTARGVDPLWAIDRVELLP